jgi:hypothetical protein
MKKVFWYEFQRSDFWALLRVALGALLHGKHTLYMGYTDTKRETPSDVVDEMRKHGYL